MKDGAIVEEKDWLILKTLYEQNSITRTAAVLFISQPALSTRIKQMEDRFGAKLFIRTKKGIRFTPAGEYLVKGSYDILQKIQTLEEHIQNMGDRPMGVLRIGASNFFTKYILPELLCRFKLQYPEIEYRVTTGWSKELVNLIYNNDVHVAFIRGDYEWPGERLLLFEEKMFICSKEPLSILDLPCVPRINYHNDYSNQVLLDKWWNENFSVSPHVGMEVDRVDTCKEMVLKGLGYAFLPETILDKRQAISTHLMVFRSGQPLIRKTWMFFQKETMDLQIVKAFYDFIKNTDFAALASS